MKSLKKIVLKVKAVMGFQQMAMAQQPKVLVAYF